MALGNTCYFCRQLLEHGWCKRCFPTKPSKMAKLERNLKRARTVHDREQTRGLTDISVRQTRRMYFASMALMRAGGAVQRERTSLQILRGIPS